jgi:hypothetical protein
MLRTGACVARSGYWRSQLNLAHQSRETPQRFPSRNVFFIYGNPSDVSLCHRGSAAQRRPCVFRSRRRWDERLQ